MGRRYPKLRCMSDLNCRVRSIVHASTIGEDRARNAIKIQATAMEQRAALAFDGPRDPNVGEEAGLLLRLQEIPAIPIYIVEHRNGPVRLLTRFLAKPDTPCAKGLVVAPEIVGMQE
jgi:hypothetical protein